MLANLIESQQSEQSNPNVGKAGKEKQPHSLWTSKEEETLLVAMLDCLGDKWKVHNGFKISYFTVVKKELRKLLPGTTLRVKPNIESKVKGWKEKYGLLADMIRVSGFAWNHARQCVDVDDTTVWEEYERTHKRVSGMNGKAFPMFEDWQTLFGHDRATGEMAEDAPKITDGTTIQTPGLDDAWNDCYSPSQSLYSKSNVNPSIPRGNANPSTPRGDVNPSTLMPNIPVPERPKKKAKLDALNEMMKGFIAQNNAHMEKLTNAIGYDKELSNKRKSVFSELMKLDMDKMDMFKVNNIIVAGEERLDAFFVIPDHMKQRWVEGVLDGKVKF
ncbi:calcium-dependent protein kinase (CDPK) family protein [Actinidia rufa]|uniref:Calcium-dependent protein kinase (CDPK) family protein n=1 Tax=Actinidia rufa TaxID=165716 RepID=A0A7J0H9X3_9ERIC|nr:calcium-dependent protein kinase (CDPK) family protein [Actinidia rufa]